jgi:glutamate---cysteine ligase / carboxylate-amine ligase
VGVEEELMLLDPGTGSVANAIDAVLAALPPALRGNVTAETHACVVELRSAAHATVAGVVEELAGLRRSLAGILRQHLDVHVAAAGTHPLVRRSEVAVASGDRYREISATMRALAFREPTMALHVHVSVPDATSAVRALDGLRADLPLVLAMSANSPFWRGEDSGFASMRVPIFSMFPRTGIARAFGSYEAYVHVLERLLRAGAIREPGFVWWDARLQPRLGTVEVRIMDAQSRTADVAGIAAVIQCLVRRCASGVCAPPADAEVLAENRFLAARDGMDGELITDLDTRVGARVAVAELLDRCRPHAEELGCVPELDAAAALAFDPGYGRQRRVAAAEGVSALPAWLGGEYALAGPVVAGR